MRLTSPLMGNLDRRVLKFKQLWATQGKRKILECPTHKLLKEQGAPIIDANKLVAPAPQKLEKINIPEPWCPPQAYDKSHPKWKPIVCHRFNNRSKLAEGLLQAQLLTNTVVHQGLPKSIEDLVGVAGQLDQDELVQRCILSSQVYDGWQVKLPKKIDITRPGHTFARPFGTPVSRKLQLLMRHLLRIMESQTGNYQGFLQRSILNSPECVITTKKNADLLQFDMMIDLLLTAKEPLAPFASKEEVTKVNSAEMPNIFPVKYTIDLQQTNIYDKVDFFPINKTFSNPYVHTVYMLHKYQEHSISKSQKMAKAMAACYTVAAFQARNLYGDVKDLPEPIAVQCVVNNGHQWSFMAYQLNTLALDDSEVTRNMAWIAPDMQLWEVFNEEGGKIQFEGYNPEVYKWLLAMYLNGLTSGRPLSTSHLMPTMNPDAGRAQPEQ